MRWVSLTLLILAVLGGAGALLFGAVKAGIIVGAAAVLAAVGGGVLWILAVVRTAAENAVNKHTIESRRQDTEGEKGA